MTEFERNETNLIKETIRKEVEHPNVGVVVQVYEHRVSDDDANWEVDIVTDGGSVKHQRCPVFATGSNSIAPPKNGDKMIILYTKSRAKKPIAIGTGWSATDRPPVGRAGMYRNRFESGDSPLGEGDLHLTGYTSYSGDVASTDKRELDAKESLIQIAKHSEGENVDPTDLNDLPVKVELYDSPENDAGHVSIEINGVNSSDTSMTWGFKLDFKTGEFKLVDPNGYGIKSDGYGNLTFEYDTKTENQVSGGGSLSL